MTLCASAVKSVACAVFSVKIYRFCLLLTVVACATAKHSNYVKRIPSAETQNKIFQAQLTEILTPYIATLDRDLWTYRWENIEKEKFDPQSVEDLIQRIGPWANRFWDSSIKNGADTGPGVYVSADPVGTSNYGGENPRLFAIKIKRGTKFIIGDQYDLPLDVSPKFYNLIQEMNCGSSTTDVHDIGHLIGYLRMSESSTCRQVVVNVLESFGIRAISYSFTSAPVPNCRSVGTAVSIIDSNAISLEEINGYTTDRNIEGNSTVTPFIKSLYAEMKDDFYAQSLLEDLKTWSRYKKAFGFFDRVDAVNDDALEKWKSEHIAYCGPIWSIERDNPEGLQSYKLRLLTPSDLSELTIKLKLTYREHYKIANKENTLLNKIPSSLNIKALRGIKDRLHPSQYQLDALANAFFPNLNSSPDHGKKEYADLLKKCIHQYESKKFENVVRGECGPIQN